MLRFILAIVFNILVTGAAAQDTQLIGIPSPAQGVTMVRIEASPDPNALAQITFYNAQINSPLDPVEHTLSYQDLSVLVVFGFNVSVGGADSITVVPPLGVYAEPESLTLLEGYSGIVTLYPLGMS